MQLSFAGESSGRLYPFTLRAVKADHRCRGGSQRWKYDCEHTDKPLRRAVAATKFSRTHAHHYISLGLTTLIDLVSSAHDRSAVRPSAACSVRTAGAIHRSSVIGVFTNDRSPIRSSTARSIHAIDASGGVGLMSYSKPAKHDDYGEREFVHASLPLKT